MSRSEKFGKYRLTRRLAFGGMAELFLANLEGDDGFAKTVVVKRILPQFSSDPAFMGMFRDEAVIAAKLSHPNLVQVYDFGNVGGLLYIALEYVDGLDLQRLILAAQRLRRPFSYAEVATIGEGMARGLAYAHGAKDTDGSPLGIVHRDISPHNVMVSRQGTVKVMDFGIAKAAARATHTATGTIKGKVAYMSPEQAGGLEVDCRSDQYSLALVLWELLTGSRHYSADSEMALLRAVMAGDVAKPSSLRDDIPAELENIVMRSLSYDADLRYPNLVQFAEALAEFRYGLGSLGRIDLAAVVEEFCAQNIEQGAESKTAVLADPGTTVLPDATPTPPSPRVVPQADVGAARTHVIAHSSSLRWVGLVGLVLLAAGVVAAVLLVSDKTPSPVSQSTVPADDVSTRDGGATARPTEPAPPPPVPIPVVAPVPPLPVPPIKADAAPVERPVETKNQSAKTGFLSLRSRGPWVEVFVDGRLLGATPLNRITVPAGALTLRLRNPGAGIDQVLRIEVAPGEHVRQTVQ